MQWIQHSHWSILRILLKLLNQSKLHWILEQFLQNKNNTSIQHLTNRPGKKFRAINRFQMIETLLVFTTYDTHYRKRVLHLLKSEHKPLEIWPILR